MRTLPHRHIGIGASLAMTMTLALSACQALDSPDSASADSGISAPTPTSEQRGEKLYRSSCKWCHGNAGEGGVVQLREVAPGMEDEMLADIIVNGDKDKGMPAHGSLTEEQVANLISFIRSWQR